MCFEKYPFAVTEVAVFVWARGQKTKGKCFGCRISMLTWTEPQSSLTLTVCEIPTALLVLVLWEVVQSVLGGSGVQINTLKG